MKIMVLSEVMHRDTYRQFRSIFFMKNDENQLKPTIRTTKDSLSELYRTEVYENFNFLKFELTATFFATNVSCLLFRLSDVYQGMSR